jgi:hypothetical protein
MQTVERAGFQLGIDVSSIDVTDATEIEHRLESFARRSAGGLIVLPEPITASHKDLIVTFQIATFGPTKLLKVLQECGVHALPNRIMFVYRVQNSESAELLGRLCGCDT